MTSKETLEIENVAPVKHAYWVRCTDVHGNIYYVCSNCKEELPRVQIKPATYDCIYGETESIDPTKYCPNCGAKMDKKKEEK